MSEKILDLEKMRVFAAGKKTLLAEQCSYFARSFFARSTHLGSGVRPPTIFCFAGQKPTPGAVGL